ncbi:formin-like protein 14 [Triticum aestivum]|uniref:formin-like protein 14 n=1 Tax=Triticum aestivum TaxID=4565 RepID=UPI001D025D45|nr:formin-like protein 14 [Triticum aestivum]
MPPPPSSFSPSIQSIDPSRSLHPTSEPPPDPFQINCSSLAPFKRSRPRDSSLSRSRAPELHQAPSRLELPSPPPRHCLASPELPPPSASTFTRSPPARDTNQQAMGARSMDSRCLGPDLDRIPSPPPPLTAPAGSRRLGPIPGHRCPRQRPPASPAAALASSRWRQTSATTASAAALLPLTAAAQGPARAPPHPDGLLPTEPGHSPWVSCPQRLLLLARLHQIRPDACFFPLLRF